jgi:outer membrane protein OmpA-like peptidoglycan-associated protein
MRSWVTIAIAGCLFFVASSLAGAADPPGPGKDYPPFVPLPGWKRTHYVEHRVDRWKFHADNTGNDRVSNEGNRVSVEGHFIGLRYDTKDEAASPIELLRTLQEQAKSVNAEVLYQVDPDRGDLCSGSGDFPFFAVRFPRNNVRVWVTVACGGLNQTPITWYGIAIVEEKVSTSSASPDGNAMDASAPTNSPRESLPASAPAAPALASDATDSTGRQRVAAGSTESVLDAAGRSARSGSTEGLLDATGKPIQAPIAPTLKATGHVQVYVNFVTDSAQLQGSSNAVLNELAATLKASPELKVDLVGHTDAVGSDAHNMELSKRRAAAVYLWLVQHGISHDRLQSEGHGFLEPIATNETSEGRALNRRVEVKTTG